MDHRIHFERNLLWWAYGYVAIKSLPARMSDRAVWPQTDGFQRNQIVGWERRRGAFGLTKDQAIRRCKKKLCKTIDTDTALLLAKLAAAAKRERDTVPFNPECDCG